MVLEDSSYLDFLQIDNNAGQNLICAARNQDIVGLGGFTINT